MKSTMLMTPVMPPMLLRVRIENRQHRFGLWVPLFLVGPLAMVLLLVLGVLLLPFIPIAAVVLWRRGFGEWVLLGTFLLLHVVPMLFVLLCALRGLTVDVTSGREQVYIAFR